MPAEATPPLSLTFGPEVLRPIVEAVVEQTVARLDAARRQLPDKLAYSEEEAARLLGVHTHVLRDERLRGRITASQIVGRRIRYLHADLIEYLMRNRVGSAA